MNSWNRWCYPCSLIFWRWLQAECRNMMTTEWILLDWILIIFKYDTVSNINEMYGKISVGINDDKLSQGVVKVPIENGERYKLLVSFNSPDTIKLLQWCSCTHKWIVQVIEDINKLFNYQMCSNCSLSHPTLEGDLVFLSHESLRVIQLQQMFTNPDCWIS